MKQTTRYVFIGKPKILLLVDSHFPSFQSSTFFIGKFSSNSHKKANNHIFHNVQLFIELIISTTILELLILFRDWFTIDQKSIVKEIKDRASFSDLGFKLLYWCSIPRLQRMHVCWTVRMWFYGILDNSFPTIPCGYVFMFVTLGLQCFIKLNVAVFTVEYSDIGLHLKADIWEYEPHANTAFICIDVQTHMKHQHCWVSPWHLTYCYSQPVAQETSGM